MLKIFLPLDITNKSGPLELLNKKDSKYIKSFNDIDKSKKRELFIGDGNILYGFSPTICCHKDGIPLKDIKANQIMFQLNPSKKWVINSRIYRRNFLKKNKIGIWTDEPKFPHFSYLFDAKILFK